MRNYFVFPIAVMQPVFLPESGSIANGTRIYITVYNADYICYSFQSSSLMCDTGCSRKIVGSSGHTVQVRQSSILSVVGCTPTASVAGQASFAMGTLLLGYFSLIFSRLLFLAHLGGRTVVIILF